MIICILTMNFTVFAADVGYDNEEISKSEELIDVYNHDELLKTIREDLNNTSGNVDSYFTSSKDAINNEFELVSTNEIKYTLTEKIDNTDDLKTLERSFKEPVLIYSVSYTSVGLTRLSSQPVQDITYFSYLTSNVLISGSLSVTGRKAVHSDVIVDGSPVHTEYIVIDDMYFSWTKSGGTSYNGVTHIDYTFIQDSYGPLPADYISNGDYGWPEHYTSGNVTKYSGFSYYSVLMPSIINSGFAKCTADITLMYNDGASTTTISKVAGFGNYGG